MSRIDDIISGVSYVLECLEALREITESGDCNSCEFEKFCDHKPKYGELVRYNCCLYTPKGAKDTEGGHHEMD